MDLTSEVTIGIPAYNEESRIGQTLEAALSQRCTVIVSDNDSTDATEAICLKYKSNHQNLQYLKQPKNIGSWSNFLSLVEAAKTPYFMWLGAHDLLNEYWVQELHSFLQADPSFAGAFGNFNRLSETSQPGEVSPLFTPSDFLLRKLRSDDPVDRLFYMATKCPHCVLIQSLFRTSMLREACANLEPHLGGDLTILTRVARLGKLGKVSSASYTYLDFTQEQIAARVDPIERWIKNLNAPDASYKITGYGYMRRSIYYCFRDVPKSNRVFGRLKQSILGRSLKRYLNKAFGPFVYP